MISALFSSSYIFASAGTIWESEDNGDFDIADVTYDDYDNRGYISYSDVYGTNTGDIWKVTFTYDGHANFFLGSIPSGCNYDMAIYDGTISTVLATSFNTGSANELITLDVTAGSTYYIYIFSASGYSSSSAYLFRTKNYTYARLGKKLAGQIYNRTYYIGMASNDYINPCINAINDWNSAVNPANNGTSPDFYFTRVYSPAGATFSFWGEYQPDLPWAGYTRLYDVNGNLLNDLSEIINYTTMIWVRASIIYNTDKAPTSNSYFMKSIANHEIGHALGLAHVLNPNAVMYPYYNTCNVNYPTEHEIKGIQAIY